MESGRAGRLQPIDDCERAQARRARTVARDSRKGRKGDVPAEGIPIFARSRPPVSAIKKMRRDRFARPSGGRRELERAGLAQWCPGASGIRSSHPKSKIFAELLDGWHSTLGRERDDPIASAIEGPRL